MVLTEVVVEGLSFEYGDTPVLSGIDLRIDRNELVCILGPNGVGKTTLVKCFNKLLKPTSGKVVVDGKDIGDMGLLEIARKMAFVPNAVSSVFSMSVVEAILMGRHPHAGWTTTDKDMDAVEDAIRIMGLEELSDRDIRELSAGQLQRVILARGLVQEPEMLILDEPTSNLDVRHQMDVMRFLKRYAREKGITVIMVCHDLNITAAFADRVIVMHGGGIYADGTAWDVLTEDNIKRVYEVNARVIDVEGSPHIILMPGDDKD